MIPAAAPLPPPPPAVAIDGRVAPGEWEGARRLAGFRTWQPVPGRPAAARVTAWVAVDAEAFWVAFRVEDPEPGALRAGLGWRDDRMGDDRVGFLLDPDGRGERAFLFSLNAEGVPWDAVRVEGVGEDASWDARWEGAARPTPAGFEAEFRVPWRSVRHPPRVDTVGLILFAKRSRNGELATWPALDPDLSTFLGQSARLAGPGEVVAPDLLELWPEFAVGWTESGPGAEGCLAAGGVSAGLSATWRPVAGVGIAGTLNPDYSQIEADASQVVTNTRDAISFEEKRPFFLEGREWFGHPFDELDAQGSTELLYTRSMVTPCLGTRAVVRRGGWTTAALHVWDATPAPSVSEGGGWTADELGDAGALESMVRLRWGRTEDNWFGAVFSDRTVPGADLSNRLAGVDGRVRLGGATALEGTLLGSATVLDPGGPVRTDAAGGVRLTHRGRHLRVFSRHWYIGPDFRAENGFTTRADTVGGVTEGHWRWETGWSRLPAFSVEPLDLTYAWTTGGELRDLWWDPSVWGVSGRGGFAKLDLAIGGERYADVWLGQTRVELYAQLRPASWLRGWVDLQAGQGPYYDAAAPRVGWLQQAATGLTLTPGVRWTVEVVGVAERYADGAGPVGDEPVYLVGVAYATARVFLTPRWSVRLSTDLDADGGAAWAEGLLGWEGAPGRVLYLGGNTGWDALPWAGGWRSPDAWQVFAKVGWSLGVGGGFLQHPT